MRKIAALLALSLLLPMGAGAQSDLPGPAAGDRFPHTLAALDHNGDERTLSSLYGDNGAAVFFVRSADWCPFCQRQLADINQRLDEFESAGLSVISVSVDEVPMIREFHDAQKIGYTMLADPDGAINESLGIRDPQYPVGSAAFGVPRPTAYIIDREGIVRLRYMEPTYRTRPDLDVMLEDIVALKLGQLE